MKVRIYERNDDGEPHEIGAIVLKDSLLIPDPKISRPSRICLLNPFSSTKGKTGSSLSPRMTQSVFCERSDARCEAHTSGRVT